ncbi:threonine synthase [Arenibacter sp. GZD96]|uniref:threonine synthase n=1 Tax=Aurantibrevibacter litoralis TaxID=3106030 RepID=UPI002AFE923B|nr:threonine synthase [Arenibacter sp. GZD-96]MEA1784900.1 threonine synthase [Arenibacter sp. GZD-96]
MNFFSLNKKAPEVSFKDAVINGIAPDRGLYFPTAIRPLPTAFFETIEQYSDHEIAFKAIHQFVADDIPEEVLKEIIANVLDFDFPLIEIDDHTASLELFHGPTLAFKDVGARFMAQCLGFFSKDSTAKVTVLVATSGDTGGAVANGFLGVDGVNVVILYPSGKVSDIQEKQLTTLGKNITALEVNGTFDDCQEMVKTAFLDTDINKMLHLTSANSINVARWLPQMFYFLFAYKRIKSLQKEIVFSVPSGNFGNLCAGIIAQQLGMPARHFIAATNVNDVVPQFMVSGSYVPKPSKATISNAMDVGDPSNFIRIRHIFENDLAQLRRHVSAYSFTDEATKNAMRTLYHEHTYVADPHGAVAYLGLKKYQQTHSNAYGIFLETAHPVKFLDVVEDTIRENIELPEKIRKLMDKKKKTIKIANYIEFKNYLFMS